MKKIFPIILIVLFFSCKEKKIEFIKSEPSGNLILIKNLPKEDSLLKNQISDFLNSNYDNYDKSITTFSFYRYNTVTKYFLKNRGDYSGGFSDHNLDQYPEDNLADFIISKCEDDSTKLVGRLHFFGLKGSNDGQKEIDTIIHKCN